MSVKLLTEHHLDSLSLKGGCTGSSESTLVKMPPRLKSSVTSWCQYSDLSFLVKMKNNTEKISTVGCVTCQNCNLPTIRMHCSKLDNCRNQLYELLCVST